MRQDRDRHPGGRLPDAGEIPPPPCDTSAVTWSVRPMSAADLPRAAELAGELGYPIALDRFAARFFALADRRDHALLVAARDTAAIGGWTEVELQHRLIADPYAEISALVVDAGLRRQGIGRTLVAAAEAWAGARGLARVRVRSNAARDAAHHFYPGLGYVLAKTSHTYERLLDRSS
jgi:GNAT superfamily N-acetyltransferase